eukprot:6200507-Pleurochrysis_carterae.AAC.1
MDVSPLCRAHARVHGPFLSLRPHSGPSHGDHPSSSESGAAPDATSAATSDAPSAATSDALARATSAARAQEEAVALAKQQLGSEESKLKGCKRELKQALHAVRRDADSGDRSGSGDGSGDGGAVTTAKLKQRLDEALQAQDERAENAKAVKANVQVWRLRQVFACVCVCARSQSCAWLGSFTRLAKQCEGGSYDAGLSMRIADSSHTSLNGRCVRFCAARSLPLAPTGDRRPCSHRRSPPVAPLFGLSMPLPSLHAVALKCMPLCVPALLPYACSLLLIVMPFREVFTCWRLDTPVVAESFAGILRILRDHSY